MSAPATIQAADSYSLTHVTGHLFNPNGKWKYEVTLDYTGLNIDHHDMWQLARQALANATSRNSSGVTIAELGDYWTLVVSDPPGCYSHPIMVTGERP